MTQLLLSQLLCFILFAFVFLLSMPYLLYHLLVWKTLTLIPESLQWLHFWIGYNLSIFIPLIVSFLNKAFWFFFLVCCIFLPTHQVDLHFQKSVSSRKIRWRKRPLLEAYSRNLNIFTTYQTIYCWNQHNCLHFHHINYWVNAILQLLVQCLNSLQRSVPCKPPNCIILQLVLFIFLSTLQLIGWLHTSVTQDYFLFCPTLDFSTC